MNIYYVICYIRCIYFQVYLIICWRRIFLGIVLVLDLKMVRVFFREEDDDEGEEREGRGENKRWEDEDLDLIIWIWSLSKGLFFKFMVWVEILDISNIVWVIILFFLIFFGYVFEVIKFL